MTGKFITFEGLDGCGKSTQLEKLAAVLRAEGHDVVTTREPGGTGIGEQVRAVLLNSRTQGLAPMAELALMFASRAQLLEEIVHPALAAGKFVLCDRYTDSSEAYQGAGRELGVEAVLAVHRVVCRDFWPDLTILMDSDPAASVERARRRNQQSKRVRSAADDHPGKPKPGSPGAPDENRFEQENRAFFERVHQAYYAIAKREATRVFMVDARRPITTVHREIVAAVRERVLAAAK